MLPPSRRRAHANANGIVELKTMYPVTTEMRIVGPSGWVFDDMLGWVVVGGTQLSAAQVLHPVGVAGEKFFFEVWLPLMPDGTPVEPEIPGDTEPGDTEPGDTEPGDTQPGDTERDDTQPGDADDCTDPLTGQPVECEPATEGECTNPLTGQPEPCAPEVCIDEATGAHDECDSQPDCEYMCDSSTTSEDTPTSSTVPQYPGVDLTTLALTGTDWRGAAATAGVLALIGTVFYLAARRSSSDRTETGR